MAQRFDFTVLIQSFTHLIGFKETKKKKKKKKIWFARSQSIFIRIPFMEINLFPLQFSIYDCFSAQSHIKIKIIIKKKLKKKKIRNQNRTKKKKTRHFDFLRSRREREREREREIGTLKEREWTAWDKASPWASEKPLMKGKVESTATILWAWASNSSASSIVFLRSEKSIFSLLYLSLKALQVLIWRSLCLTFSLCHITCLHCQYNNKYLSSLVAL